MLGQFVCPLCSWLYAYAFSFGGKINNQSINPGLPSGDRTKTWNELGNRSKNGSNKLKIYSPSGHGKSFHGRGLTSALVTSTSMQVSPPVPPCASTTGKQNRIRGKLVSFQASYKVYCGGLGMRLGLVKKVSPVCSVMVLIHGTPMDVGS